MSDNVYDIGGSLNVVLPLCSLEKTELSPKEIRVVI